MNGTLLKLLLILAILTSIIIAQPAKWQILETGLYWQEFESPVKSDISDNTIYILKADPAYFDLKLVSVTEEKTSTGGYRIDDWVAKYHLVAAINAGMYDKDYKTHVGYMKNYKHVNNPVYNPKYHSAAAFNPVNDSLPSFRIFDINEESFDQVKKNYHSVIQNLRLIKRPRINRWQQQNLRWSECALGEDKKGDILFIFSRSPYTMHDFNNILLNLAIDIVCAQHLEGGPAASFMVNHPDLKITKVGSYETQAYRSDNNNRLHILPFVLGLVKKEH